MQRLIRRLLVRTIQIRYVAIDASLSSGTTTQPTGKLNHSVNDSLV